MLLWMHYIKGNADRKLLRILLNILLRSGLFTVLLTIHFKTLLSAAILWYHLVLERIRSAGGKGMELKTALELEMEAAMFNKPREDGTPMVVLTDG
ncbi:hypothetical protein BaOVIS_005610 [Babesia ovis]|uniref:Uncharacterized protein n=1 Tax=Babesia ovis TaxID=5869 RepID=A0A9W5WUF2_BABOV|nr:hypothetical protein BaOVIS_005610 [Babesia ovis]